MADAAYAILTKPSREFTGHFCIDEDVLRAEGVTDFSEYAVGARRGAHPRLLHSRAAMHGMDFSTPPRVADLLPAIRAFVTERIQPLERSA